MKIIGVQSLPDFGKHTIHLSCGHTFVVDENVQVRLMQPVSKILEQKSLYCLFCKGGEADNKLRSNMA